MLPKQFRIHAVLILACIFIILYPLYSEKPETEKVEQAVPVAAEFLQMIDSGQYAESWRSSASLMQEKITEKDWAEKLAKARERTGDVINRERESATYSTKAQDSPEGEYIMLIYDSKFDKAGELSEYVTVMRDGELWKVAGYFLED